MLRRMVIAVLVGVSLVLYSFSIYQFIDYFFISGASSKQALLELTRGMDYTSLHESYAPAPLKLGTPSVFGGARDRYDFLTNIENKNTQWWTEFQYRFVGAGFASPWSSGFMLPRESSYLALLGAAVSVHPRNLQVELRDMRWKRITGHDIRDPQNFVSDRTRFDMSNVKFTPATGREGAGANTAEFTVRNNTAFSFWRVPFLVIVFRGATPEAVNSVTADELRSGETRNLAVSWFETLPPVDRVEVTGRVNVFDQSVYMK